MMRLAVMLFVLILQPAVATNISTLTGEVRDQTGGVIPGVTVSLTPTSSPAPVTTATTNASGRFHFADLPTGAYDLTATMMGFKTARGKVTVAASETLTATVRLAIGALSETVHVTAPSPTAPQPATVTVSGVTRAIDRGLKAPETAGGFRAVPPDSTVAVQPGEMSSPTPGTPIRVGGSIREPRKLRDVKPIYPADAIASGASGIVIMEAIVGRDGTVQDARVLRGVPTAPSLDEAAMTAVRQWLYTPTMLNGQPIDVAMTVSVTFSLR